MAVARFWDVPKRERVMAFPKSDTNRTALLPCFWAMETHSNDVRNWERKNDAPTIPHQNPTAASLPCPTPKLSRRKKRKGPAVEAERNSLNIAMQRTRIGNVGSGFETTGGGREKFPLS